jgi:hypothetical protein
LSNLFTTVGFGLTLDPWRRSRGGSSFKQGKRNVISRHLHARDDKEKIAAWKLDLMRILDIFNVRSIASVWLLLTLHFQTELAINTHVTVTKVHHDVVNTYAITSGLGYNVASAHMTVSDIHRTVGKGQDRGDGKLLLVGDTWTVSTAE